MPEDFRGPHLKVERAKHHIEDLRQLLRRFMRAQTYKAVADFTLEPGSIIWVARGRDLFPHDEFSPFIGDVIHNLNAALDLAISILMRNGGKAAVYFPTFGSYDDFRKTILERNSPGFPEHIVSTLEFRIQPYTGGNGHWLRALRHVANLDKHELIVPTVFGVDVMHVEIEGAKAPIRFFHGPVPIKNGTRLVKTKAAQWPEVKPSQEADVTLQIAFDDRSGSLRRESIEDGMQRLLYAAESAIEALRTCL